MSTLERFIVNYGGHRWATVPFWSLFRRVKRTGFPGEELLSVYRDYGVIPKSSRDDNFNKASSNLSTYQLVEEGDLVINKMKAWQGSISVARYRGIVSPAYYVYTPQSAHNDQYLHYLLRSDPYIGLYKRISKGIRVDQWDLEHEALRNVPVLTPDLHTQHLIADFLDRETARIDQLIKKKQRLLELLEEKEAAEIHRAVTAGLDFTVRKVDSGIEWFGYVPEHWIVKPLRHLLLFQRGHDLPADQRVAGGVPLVSSAGISSEHDSAVAKAPGIVTGRYGTIGKFYFLEEDYWPLNTTLYTRRVYAHPRYCWYLLQDLSHIFHLNSSKSAVPGIDRNDIHSEPVLVPPTRAEQAAIAQWLDSELHWYERIESLIVKSIARLREFRSALITAAVTGQIDVDEWQRRETTDRRLEKIEEEMRV